MFAFFVLIFLMHEVQCRDIGHSAFLNEQLFEKSPFLQEEVTVISRNSHLLSGDETDDLTLVLSSLPPDPHIRRKRSYIGPGSYVMRLLISGQVIFYSVLRAISSFTKVITKGLIG